MNQTTGRNDPCPCGSGKKYKKCCLARQMQQVGGFRPLHPGGKQGAQDQTLPSGAGLFEHRITGPDLAREISTDIRTALESGDFKSIEQMEAYAGQLMASHNERAVPEFQGLSPAQMHRVLENPLDSPEIARFNDQIVLPDDVPIMKMFDRLVEAISAGNFKPTAKGNLPRQFCRDAAREYWGEEYHAIRTRFSGINSEQDVAELQIFHNVCEMAGYLRKYRGKFILGKQCLHLIDHDKRTDLYLGLLRTSVNEYNWGYTDRYPPLPFLQKSWLFSLYLLQILGKEPLPPRQYSHAFVKAFPMLIEEMEPSPYQDEETELAFCYEHRVLHQWMQLFGFADIANNNPKDLLRRDVLISKRSLADELVSFQV